MVFLARRALQEHQYRKSRLGCAGEGIEVGSFVSVLSGRSFPLFHGGDVGRVVRIDREALNCEVLFDGATEPVPVALRHLELKESPPERKLCRSDEDSKVQNKAGDTHGGNEKMAVDPSSCGPQPCTGAPEVAVLAKPDKKPQVKEFHETFSTPALSADPASGWQHWSILADSIAPEESPEQRTVQESTDKAHGASQPALGMTCVGIDHGSGGIPTFSLVRSPGSESIALHKVESLQAELEAMEERHRIEMTSMRAELEEAQEFARKQQARVTFLEDHIRTLSSQQRRNPHLLLHL